jgi:hypothetical protein
VFFDYICTRQRGGHLTVGGYQKERLRYMVFALFALCAGCAVYCFFRNGDLLLYTWTGIPDLPGFQRQNAGDLPRFLIWLTGSLPDGLWALSGIMLLRRVLWNNTKLCGIYLFVFCVFAFTYELLQISDKIRGTFDPADMCFMALAVVFERNLAKNAGFGKNRPPLESGDSGKTPRLIL